jgi:hypothetical protein
MKSYWSGASGNWRMATTRSFLRGTEIGVFMVDGEPSPGTTVCPSGRAGPHLYQRVVEPVDDAGKRMLQRPKRKNIVCPWHG